MNSCFTEWLQGIPKKIHAKYQNDVPSTMTLKEFQSLEKDV